MDQYQGKGKFEDRSELPKKYEYVKFYESEKKLTEGLFDVQAESIAQSFVGKDNRGNVKGVSPTQLRRVFDEVKRFERLLDADESSWEKQKPYIQLIKSKVAYTVARAKKRASNAEKNAYDNLINFISNGIKETTTAESYKVFASLFEAVYGFYYGKAPRE